jgi:eukaryotic-like serine/threonine-protein kinase
VTISEDRPRSFDVERSVVLDGRFRLERRLADDAMAEVWRAEDLQLDRTVVVRVLHAKLREDPLVLERFRLEALAAARLSHGHVANLFDVAVHDDLAYTVGEYVDGPSLARLLDDGPLEPAAVAAIGQQAASGLAAAHAAEIIHRDVRPGNLLVGRDGRVRIVDFGSARIPDPEREALADLDHGAESYLAPELGTGGLTTDRSDVYALARTLLKALDGVHDAPARDDGVLDRVLGSIPGLPIGTGGSDRLREEVAGAMDPDPTRRPSATEFADALGGLYGPRGEEILRSIVAGLGEDDYGRRPG